MANHTFLKNTLEKLVILGDISIIEESFSESYTAHAGDKTFNGHKFIKNYTSQIRKSISNIKLINFTVLSENNNLITWQRSFSGTHIKQLKGIPASNKKIKWYEIVVSKIENKKIVEEWLVSDLAFQLMVKHKNN